MYSTRATKLHHRRPLAIGCAPTLVLGLALGGCGEFESGAGLVSEDIAVRLVAEEWLGTYEGPGEGTAGGMTLQVADARLRIVPDADAVKLPDCPQCVTVVLDTMFVRVNVEIFDPVHLEASYWDGGATRTLVMDRFSGGGGTANVLRGRVVISGSGPSNGADVSYLLEKR